MAGKRIVAILLAFLLAATSVNMQSVTAQANEGEDIIVFDEDSLVTQDAESEILDDESGSAIKTTDTVTGYEELEAQLKAIEEGSSDVEVLSEEEYLIESFEILLSDSDSNVANPEDYEVLTYDKWQYYLDEDNYAHLVGYTDNSVSELEVPARFGKYIVVSIEKGAFSGLESLASIVIPFYVTNIDEKAFETPVSIKAYNGAYALSYAAYYGYTYENLSSLDFANGVYDFSQIIRSHYSFRTNLDIEMDEAEARLLDVDSVFFLPESEELPNGDAFKVISITDEGEHKLIHCERAIGAEALDRLSFEDYDLKPDWENAIYYFDFDNDGNYESVPADELEWENGKAELISPLTAVNIDIDDEKHLIISIDEKKTKSGEPYSTDIGDYVKFNVAIEDTISVNAVADIDLRKRKIYSFLLEIINETSISASLEGEWSEYIPLGKVPIQSIGIESVYVEFNLGLDVSGNITVTATLSEKGGVQWVNGNLERINELEGGVDLTAEATASIYLQEALMINALATVDCGVFVDEGIEADYSLKDETIIIYAFADCGAKAKVTFLMEEIINEEKKSERLKHELKTIYLRQTDYTVKFVTSKSYVKVEDQSVKKDGLVKEPYVKSVDNCRVTGWYKDPAHTQQWDFAKDKVTKNITLYAKWEKVYKACFHVGNDVRYVSCLPGKKVTKPFGYNLLDYVLEGWYTESTYKNRWDFGKDLMPEHDLDLYAKIDSKPGYDPWSGNEHEPEISDEDAGDGYSNYGFKYEIVNKEYVKITGFRGNGGKVVVPSVIAGYPVESIADYAFQNCTGITSLVIPDSVTSIGYRALKGCTSLESLTTPFLCYGISNTSSSLGELFEGTLSLSDTSLYASLKKVTITKDTVLDSSAFSNWKNLEEINLPDNMTEIGSYAFNGCAGLKGIRIPSAVRTIGGKAFCGCESIEEFSLPGNLETIGDFAFEKCTGITSLVIPDSVTSIGYSALKGCTSLESLTTPFLCYGISNTSSSLGELFEGTLSLSDTSLYASLKKVTITKDTVLDSSAFSNWKNLEEINLPDNMTEIGSYAFNGCAGLKGIKIPSAVRTIGGKAFCGCESIEEFSLPGNLETIGDFAFENCTGITSLVIPDSVTSIGYSALKGCTSLESLTTPFLCYGISHTSSSLGELFEGTLSLSDTSLYASLKKVTITKDTVLDSSAFSNWKNLEEINLPDNMTEIGSYAFNGCAGLKEIRIPSAVKTISGKAFSGCESLEEISLPGSLQIIGEFAFENCTGITSLVIPDAVTSIGYSSLKGCTSLESLTTPFLCFSTSHTSSCLGELFEGTLSISISESSKYALLKKVTITKDTTIDSYAFRNWDNIVEINLPGDLVSISNNAFSGCSSLTSLVIPSTATTIADKAFENCTGLTQLKVYSKNVTYSYNPFTGANANLILYGYIGSTTEGFATANNIQFQDIEGRFANVTFVQNNGLNNIVYNCDIGKTIPEIPEVKWSGYTFAGWFTEEELKTKWNPDIDLVPAAGITLYAAWIEEEAVANDFAYESKDGSITIIRYLGSNPIVSIPKKIKGLPVTAIGSYAFSGMDAIKKIIIPASVESIADNAFEDSAYISAIVVSDDNMSFSSEDGVLYDKDKTTLIIYPLGSGAESFTVPVTVVTLGNNAFKDSRLSEITLHDNILTIGKESFANCKNLTVLNMPAGVKTIGDFAFWGDSGIRLFGPVGNPVLEEYATKNNISYNEYALKFIDDDNEYLSVNLRAGTKLSSKLKSILKEISKDNYELKEWRKDNKDGDVWDIDSEAMPAQDTVLYAVWSCDYGYTVDGSNVTVSSANNGKKDYIVPDALDGKPVTKIATGAFTNSNILSVTIPATVTEIEIGAFNNRLTIKADPDSYAKTYADANNIDFQKRKYELSFDTRGGTAIASRYYAKGDSFSQIADPVKDNHVFDGWYSDESLTTKIDLSTQTMPGAPLTIYAGWKKINANLEDMAFTYKVENGKIVITGYNGNEKYLVIPSSINGTEVNAIDDYAFYKNEKIAALFLPDSIVRIGNSAFSGCSHLEEIEFGSGLASLGEYAFSDCGSLNRVDLSSLTLITELPKGCFMYNTNLFYVTLPKGLLKISDYAFDGCTYLQEIVLPEGLKTIGAYAFYTDRYLESITIPASVTEIGEGFIDGCLKLSALDVADGNQTYTVKDNMLYKGTTLIRCPEAYSGDGTIDSSINAFAKGAFKNCTNISSITIPTGVKTISELCFFGCTLLENIVIPDNITRIEANSFAGCSSLQELIIGKTVTFVGNSAFAGDSVLTIKGYANTAIATYAEKNNLKFEYIKSDSETAKAPVVEAIDRTTITLREVPGYEYSCGGEIWQESNVFADLQPATEYTFYQRVAENTEHTVGQRSDGVKATTGKLAGVKLKAPIIMDKGADFVTVASVNGAEYSINGVRWTLDSTIRNLDPETEYTLYQRMAETDTTEAGEASFVVFSTDKHSGPCKVVFDANGGLIGDKEILETEVEENTAVERPQEPERANYSFEGWYKDDELYDFASLVKGDLYLTAKWNEIISAKLLMPYVTSADGSVYESGAELEKGTLLYLTSDNHSALIYYTTDSSEAADIPEDDAHLYKKAIKLEDNTTIYAKAVKEGYVDSDIAVFTYVLKNTAIDWGDVSETDREGMESADDVPEGIWATGYEDRDYTGSAITFETLHVYYGKTLLNPGEDYTVKYSNNIKASTDRTRGTITITGKGNFSGTRKEYFNIIPLSLGENGVNSDALTVADVQAEYTGKKIQLATTVVYQLNDKEVVLKKGTDFTYEYSGNEIQPGDYTIKIKGKGNYSGTATFTETITDNSDKTKTNISKLTFTAIKAQSATGEEIRPELMIKDKVSQKEYKKAPYTLVEESDYHAEYLNNTAPGTATVVVTGRGKYIGTKTLTFKINGIAISKAKFAPINAVTYNGSAQEPECKLTYQANSKAPIVELNNGVDYEVTYANNINKGTATVTFTGKGKYTGTAKKTFKIVAHNFGSKDVTVVYGSYMSSEPEAAIGNFAYTKNGVKPDIRLIYKGEELVLNRDYKLKYANNNAVGATSNKTPKITITGTGNFAGTITRTFTIGLASFANTTITVTDIVANGKVGSCKPTIAVYDTNGVKLVAGKDYDKTVEYFYVADTTIQRKDAKTKKTEDYPVTAGTPVDVKNDIIPSGTDIRVTITGKGNYDPDTSNYAVFTYVDNLLGKANVTLKQKTYDYTGKKIELSEDDLIVKLGKVVVPSGAYRITSITQNVQKGTAKVTITGVGKYDGKYYGGSKTVTFRINAKKIN